jgi:hypothetical protein
MRCNEGCFSNVPEGREIFSLGTHWMTLRFEQDRGLPWFLANQRE